MGTVSDFLKVFGGFTAFVLFVVFITWITKPTPLPSGIVSEKWYDDQYASGYFFSVKGEVGKVSARTYYRVPVGGWYDGEK